MTREQLARYLALLVRRGALTTEEAREVLRAYNAGQISPDMLPLEAAVALDPSRQDQRRTAWLAILALLGLGDPTRVQRLRDPQRRRARDLLSRSFERSVIGIAATAMSSIAEWQRRMSRAISDYTLAQATAGAGQVLNERQLARVQASNWRNLGFLALFALHAAALAVLGRPMSFSTIRHRSLLYGGMGRGQFFRAAEDGRRDGWVARYISLDDPATCSACSSYHNTFWLPDDGPYPGEICYGRGRCRCERRMEYNPEVYARLTGQRS